MQALIDAVISAVPAALTEIRRLGRTLKQRAIASRHSLTDPARTTAPPRPSMPP